MSENKPLFEFQDVYGHLEAVQVGCRVGLINFEHLKGFMKVIDVIKAEISKQKSYCEKNKELFKNWSSLIQPPILVRASFSPDTTFNKYFYNNRQYQEYRGALTIINYSDEFGYQIYRDIPERAKAVSAMAEDCKITISSVYGYAFGNFLHVFKNEVSWNSLFISPEGEMLSAVLGISAEELHKVGLSN